jgi:hypothetical protein
MGHPWQGENYSDLGRITRSIEIIGGSSVHRPAQITPIRALPNLNRFKVNALGDLRDMPGLARRLRSIRGPTEDI